MYEFEHLPDPIEIGEDRIERFMDENVRGDEMRCPECQRWLPINAEWVQMSPDPYSIPICGECADGFC